MRYMNIRLLATIVVGITLAGCAKEDDPPEDPSGGGSGGSVSSSVFSWTAGSGSKTTADSSVCYVQITTIYGYKNGTSNTVEINLSDIAQGSYQLSSTTGNALTYVQGGNTFNAKSGSVNITASGGGKISGNFSAAFPAGSVTSITGEFTDVRMR